MVNEFVAEVTIDWTSEESIPAVSNAVSKVVMSVAKSDIALSALSIRTRSSSLAEAVPFNKKSESIFPTVVSNVVTLCDSVVNLSLSASILEDREFIEDDVAATAAPAISSPST